MYPGCTLNYLIGKPDFEQAFTYLLEQHPEVARTLPALVVRDGAGSKRFQILVDYASRRLVYEEFDFGKRDVTAADVQRYLVFVTETGIRGLIERRSIKSLVDYMMGVEAGLDSNGRKNRGGTIMEEVAEGFVADACRRNGYKYLRQASADAIKEHFGVDVPVDKSSRRYDFAIAAGGRVYLVEVNFYGGGGSKLKSTAGEYRKLREILGDAYPLIWITDGAGWHSALRPLREAFDHLEYVVNLDMLEHRMLEAILAAR